MDERFEWNPAKDQENIRKRGVSFKDAELAFSDPLNITLDDPSTRTTSIDQC